MRLQNNEANTKVAKHFSPAEGNLLKMRKPTLLFTQIYGPFEPKIKRYISNSQDKVNITKRHTLR